MASFAAPSTSLIEPATLFLSMDGLLVHYEDARRRLALRHSGPPLRRVGEKFESVQPRKLLTRRAAHLRGFRSNDRLRRLRPTLPSCSRQAKIKPISGSNREGRDAAPSRQRSQIYAVISHA